MSDLEPKTVTFSVTVQGMLKTEGRSNADACQGAEEGLAELVSEFNESGNQIFSDWSINSKTGIKVQAHRDILTPEAIKKMRADLQSINESSSGIKHQIEDFTRSEAVEDLENSIEQILAVAGRIDDLLAKKEAQQA